MSMVDPAPFRVVSTNDSLIMQLTKQASEERKEQTTAMTTALDRLGDRLEKRIDGISEANTRALIAFQQAAAEDRKSDRYDRRVFNTLMLLGVLALAGINVYFKGITLTAVPAVVEHVEPVAAPADAEHAPLLEIDL
jgi:hypothetical protein